MRTIKFISIAAIVSLLEFSLSAQTFPSLLLGPELAGYGTAGATTSMGAFAMDANVAAMSLSSNRLDAAVSCGIWQPEYADNTIINAGVRCRVFKGLALGLSFRDRLQKPYDIYTSGGVLSKDGNYTPKEYNIALGASYAFLPYLSAGVSLRYLRSDLAPEAASSAFATDIALAYLQVLGRNKLEAGVSVNNLGTKLKYRDNSYALPALAELRASYSYYFGSASVENATGFCTGVPFKTDAPSSLSVSAEFDALFSGAVMAGVGLEYAFRNTLFVRAGYHYGDNAKAVPAYASVGLGLSFFGVSLNAAYIFASETLLNSFDLSLGYSF